MFTRAVVVIAVMVTQLGCGDSSTGPSPYIDPSLVGSWVDQSIATDSAGVVLCTYVALRLVLHETGQFDWDTFELDSASGDACEAATFRRDSGEWRAQDGNVVFTPPPTATGVEGPALELSYELKGDELRVGPLVFERE